MFFGAIMHDIVCVALAFIVTTIIFILGLVETIRVIIAKRSYDKIEATVTRIEYVTEDYNRYYISYKYGMFEYNDIEYFNGNNLKLAEGDKVEVYVSEDSPKKTFTVRNTLPIFLISAIMYFICYVIYCEIFRR